MDLRYRDVDAEADRKIMFDTRLIEYETIDSENNIMPAIFAPPCRWRFDDGAGACRNGVLA
jgi:hypothetical protein